MKTIAFDFDGVIHKYSKGWQDGSIYDEPVQGIRETIDELRKDYKVVIISSRANDQKQFKAMFDWLKKYSIKVDDITYLKTPAILYIDDRTISFNGNVLNLVNQIKHFKTWNEKDNELMKISNLEAEELLKQRQYEIDKIIQDLGKHKIRTLIKLLDEWIDIANSYKKEI